MQMSLYVERSDVATAEGLILQFGNLAGVEAAGRAVESRNVGNHLEFCRWRQIERLIIMLTMNGISGTVH